MKAVFISALLSFFSLGLYGSDTAEATKPKGIVVITGVTKGLGKALAQQFIQQGWVVVGCGRSAEAIEQLQNEYGSNHLFSAVDITNGSLVDEWAQMALQRLGTPNIVINNAALINDPAPLWKVSAEEFNRVIDTNVLGTFNVIHAFAPVMVARGKGLFVNISSGWGRSGSGSVAPYCTSKFAIEGLTQSLAEELPVGMAVVTLDPGAMNTDMLKQFAGDGAARYPTPEQVAKATVPYILSLTTKDNGKALSVP